jgi:hypothetical protein
MELLILEDLVVEVITLKLMLEEQVHLDKVLLVQLVEEVPLHIDQVAAVELEMLQVVQMVVMD